MNTSTPTSDLAAPLPREPGPRDPAQLLEERVVERTGLLMRAKRTWEATFDAIGDPLAIVGEDLRIVRTNLAHAKTSEVDVRTSTGRLCHDVLFGSATPCQGCPARAALESGEPVSGEVIDHERRHVYRMSAFPMRSEHGAAPQIVCHYKDVTEEKALQRQLRQTEKMVAVGTLAGGVAHEINNPLGAIQAFAQLALLDTPEGSPIHEYLVEIERCTHRCQRIVRNLLDFSHPSVGSIAGVSSPAGERQPVSLADVVARVVFLLGTQHKKVAARLETSFDDAAPGVLGDAGQLEQVAMNLIGNALQAIEGVPGRVRVSVVVNPEVSVNLVVADNGPGIEPRYLDHIFEPFFTTKPEGKGTGLGLSITYSIVKEHGATIEAESRLGEGAVFTVRFPWSLIVVRG